MTERALVLGGGGVAGIAWTTGLLAGLADGGQDVSRAELLIGTSAGAAVAAQLGSGLSLDELYARQTEPSLQAKEIPAELNFADFSAGLGALLDSATSAEDLRRRVGAFALAANTATEGDRRAAVATRLPSADWPERRMLLVAVDARTGEPRRFDRESGVALVDAVAASCAVPGIWPPVTIGGERYVDGGIRSAHNIDYAAGAAEIVVLAPTGVEPLLPTEKPLDVLADELRAAGSKVTVIVPDEASLAAIGDNALDPGTRAPAAAAGRAQGRGLRL